VVVDGRAEVQAMRTVSSSGGSLFDNVTTEHCEFYQGGNLWAGAVGGAGAGYRDGDADDQCATSTATGSLCSPTMAARREIFASQIQIGMVGINVPIQCRCRSIRSAVGSIRCSAITMFMAWRAYGFYTKYKR